MKQQQHRQKACPSVGNGREGCSPGVLPWRWPSQPESPLLSIAAFIILKRRHVSLLFPRPWKCHALSGFSELLSSLLISLLSPGFSPVAGNTYIQAYLRKLPPCEHPHRHPEVCLLGGPKSRQLTVLINHHNGRTGCIRYLGIFLRATWVGKSTLVFLMQTVVGTGPLFPHEAFW